MTSERMSLERFASILDAYGAEPRRWPPAERAAAEALAAASPEARAMLARAAVLDRLLDAAPAPAPSGTLRASVLRSTPSRPASGWRRLGGRPAVAAALAASLALGMLAGRALDGGAGVAPDAAPGVLELALLADDRAGY